MARELPIFPLPIVLFPGTPQPLHVFEPRYRQLLADCLAADRRFGIAYVPAEPEPGSEPLPRPGDVGCVALIQNTQALPDGRSNILTVGERRFVLIDWVGSDRPYRLARVEEFDDEPVEASETVTLAGDVREGFTQLAQALSILTGREDDVVELAPDPQLLSFQVAAALELAPEAKRALLALRSTTARLRQLATLVRPLAADAERRAAVLLVLTRLNRILSLDPGNRVAVVEPGVVNVRLSAAAAAHGLHYAPDPSSQTACTIGGNVAENAGGPHCLKYGVTAQHVLALEVVLADGRIVELGSPGGEPWGPDVVGLFVGSEGNFGIATRIAVRLLPLPRAVRTLLAAFASLRSAGEAVSAVIASGIVPAALEMMDQSCIRAVEDSVYAAGYPFDARVPGLRTRVDAASTAIMEACVAVGGTITGEHGVGLDKLRYMPLIFDAESLAAMRAVRRVWDPEERVNPGKVVPVHACREWTGVRSVEWGVRSVASRDAPADSALRTPHSALDT